jgi:uncharacterized protein YeeX (DUF496 family)
MSEQYDRKELKNQALLEKISNMTAQYENQVADLRVELTIAQHEKQQLEAQLNSEPEVQESDDVYDVSSLPADNAN